MDRRRRPVDPLKGICFCYVRRMADVRAASQEIVCPHCKKPFSGELLAEGSRHEGFKCPHCRLFVPAERANDDGEAPT
jgi:DNA-directed RNA polymerase subunit RPC12/RpoP